MMRSPTGASELISMSSIQPAKDAYAGEEAGVRGTAGVKGTGRDGEIKGQADPEVRAAMCAKNKAVIQLGLVTLCAAY